MPPNITPGQGLLLLIEHYHGDLKKVEQLKKLYLVGANNCERCIEFCDLLLNEPLLSNYEIDIDEESIDSDPSRRYFETHLAYQTLLHQLDLIEIDELIILGKLSSALISRHISKEKLDTILSVLDGTCEKPFFKKFENIEFNCYIKKLKEGFIFPDLSPLQREKILILERISYTAMVNGWRHTIMPIDIYNEERFGNKARGKIHRNVGDLLTIRNQNFGLVKGHMPLPADDVVRASKLFEHIKPCDYSTFDTDSPVVQACFQQLVHPFSNSISGFFLVQLRVLARLHCDGEKCDFIESLEKFIFLIRLILSCSLFYGGGHSLYEYVAVLNIPEVQEFFQYMPGFNDLDLEKIFYQNNETGFNAAFESTMNYNSHLFKRKTVNNELLRFFKCTNKTSHSSSKFSSSHSTPHFEEFCK